ncbi:MAG TPA: hypothetical protein VGR22_02085 [Thermomicrobiales bacterium]|nr:hypothetical protein [Thermomicrobiales bacterium]
MTDNERRHPLRSRPPQEPPEVDESQEDDTHHKIFGLGIPRAESRQPAYGQGVVVSLLTAGAVLILAIITVGNDAEGDPPVFESTSTVFWIVAVVVMVLAATGAQFAERTATFAAEKVGQPRLRTTMATAWTVPLVATFAAIVLAATFHNQLMLLVSPLIAFIGTAGALLSRDLLDEVDEQSSRVASTIHTLVVHGVAFFAFSAVYLNKLDIWLAGPLIAIIAFLLTLETLERAGVAPPRRIFFSLASGWVLFQSMFALDWWPTYGWAGGAVLLAVFYIVAGLILVYCESGRVQQRDYVEFGAVGGIAILLLALLG